MTDTTFNPAYKVKDLKPHPQNPRRDAKADPEMVASIKEHGVLEPIVIGPDGTIIMGHRRANGSTQAKRATAPVLIRHDLDTPEKQLEVQLVENLHRLNLTELEEAESFGLLKDMGYSQKQIASKVGRSPRLVSERLKLLRLSKKSQDALHKGQMSFADAVALAEFDDDPKLQDRLAKKAGTYHFENELDRVRRDREAWKEINARISEYDKAGVPEVAVKKGTRRWDLRTDAAMLLENTNAGNRPQSHKKCMAYVVLDGDTYTAPSIERVCTNHKGHKKRPTKAELDRKAEQERAAAERKAAQAAWDAAADARFAAVLGVVGAGVKLDSRIADLLRALLPAFVWQLDGAAAENYYAAVEVPAEQQWGERMIYGRTDEDLEGWIRHCEALATAADSVLVKAVVAVLLDANGGQLRELTGQWAAQGTNARGRQARATAGRYLSYLAGIGHEFTDVDEQLLEASRWEPPADEEAAS